MLRAAEEVAQEAEGGVRLQPLRVALKPLLEGARLHMEVAQLSGNQASETQAVKLLGERIVTCRGVAAT